MDVLRHAVAVAGERQFLQVEPVFLHRILTVASQEKRDEFVGAIGIRRAVQNGDGIDRFGCDGDGKRKRRYLGVRCFRRIEEADIQLA